MATSSKLATYAKEVAFCFSIGNSFSDKCRLSWNTLSFHIANGLKLKRGATDPSMEYAICYGGRALSIQLRKRAGDLFIFHEVFGLDTYRPPPQIHRGIHTVIDLGANIGLTTLYLQSYFPQATYICVEPDPANAALLRHNIGWMGSQAHVLEAAISDSTGHANFDSDGLSYGGRLTARDTGTIVPCETMESVLDQFGIDSIGILKVDIEGAEKQLFKNAASWLPRVQTIVIEIHHPYNLDQFKVDIELAGFTLLLQSEQFPMLWAHRDEKNNGIVATKGASRSMPPS